MPKNLRSREATARKTHELPGNIGNNIKSTDFTVLK